jgi:hypothetical protein
VFFSRHQLTCLPVATASKPFLSGLAIHTSQVLSNSTSPF